MLNRELTGRAWVSFYVWCEVGSTFIILSGFLVFSTVCWKRHPFPIKLSWCPCQKLADHSWESSFLGSPFYTSAPSVCPWSWLWCRPAAGVYWRSLSPSMTVFPIPDQLGFPGAPQVTPLSVTSENVSQTLRSQQHLLRGTAPETHPAVSVLCPVGCFDRRVTAMFLFSA